MARDQENPSPVGMPLTFFVIAIVVGLAISLYFVLG